MKEGSKFGTPERSPNHSRLGQNGVVMKLLDECGMISGVGFIKLATAGTEVGIPPAPEETRNRNPQVRIGLAPDVRCRATQADRQIRFRNGKGGEGGRSRGWLDGLKGIEPFRNVQRLILLGE